MARGRLKFKMPYLECTFILATKQSPHPDWKGFGGIVGDVNVYLNQDDPIAAEIEIMVAEKSCRNGGIATEALRMMMHYCHTTIGVTVYIAKISDTNLASKHLFEKFGFVQIGFSKVFNEVTLELHLDEKHNSIDQCYQVVKVD